MPRAAPARRTRTATIREVMEPLVVTVVPQMTVRELVELFAEERIRGAPVVGPLGKVVGLVSESDVLRHALASAAPAAGGASASGWDPDRVRVHEVMGPVGAVWSPGDELPSLQRAFAHDGTQRALVIENGILLGIVTPADLLRNLPSAD